MFSRVPLIGGRWLQAFKPVAISVIGVGAWGLFTLPLSGADIVPLPNGDYLIVDPDYDLPGSPPVPDVGAVHYYASGSGAYLGTLRGSTANDQVGSGGITLMGTDVFVVHSPSWDNGAAVDAGAVTRGGHPSYGPFGGVVSASNSLVGSTANDQVGSGGITLVGTDVFVVHSPSWDNGVATDAGAVTRGGHPSYGPFGGVVSASNSLVGSSTGDQVGSGGITLVGTDVFVVHSPSWDNGVATDAGAVTRGGSPIYGPFGGVVSASNSLVGSSTGDQVGSGGIITVTGTDIFLVCSPSWDNEAAVDAGAVTRGTHPVFGPFGGVVSASNSLVGSTANDQVGSGGIITLTGTDIFLVRSPSWHNGAAVDAGAVTRGGHPSYGPFGGVVSASNSLVGSTAYDQVGSGGITLVGTDVFVVHSPSWDNGAAVDAGAVTRGGHPSYGSFGGVISASNSLVGSMANDQVGSGGITLVGTDVFVVHSPSWDNGAAVDAGAVTRGGHPSYGPFGGVVSASNSLVGASAGDQVGSGGIIVAENGAFLVRSPFWDHGPAINAGAMTLGGHPFDGPFAGVVSAANSMVGSHPNDLVGSGGNALPVSFQSILMWSPNWCYGAGAFTPVNLTYPVRLGSWAGVVSAVNSMVGAESAEPEIVLRQPSPTEMPSGSSRDFGGVAANATSSLAFTIHNTGTDDLLLNGLPKVAVTGPDAALFSIVSQPRDLIVTGDSATFTVNFTPTGTGTKTAQLSISTNDGNESPYVIQLTGTVLLPISDWRQTHFGGSANSGNAADTADFDHDGVANILEYAFGLHPGQNSAGQLPLPARNDGDLTVVFNQPAHVSGVVYEAEWSTSLAPTSWLPVPDTGVPPLHVFTVPAMGNTQVFMRFKVSPSL
jgi:hypothetical protein